MALNPAVDRLERRFGRRGAAAGLVFLGAIAAIALIGWLLIPTLVDQVNNFAHKVPDYLDDVTKGRGRLGFLQEKYHLVDKARKALREGGASKLFGLSGTALAVAKGVVNAVLATVTIAFMTFFMLLEGPNWIDRFFSLLRPDTRTRWRAVGHDIYRTVGGYVSGNLLIYAAQTFGVLIPLYAVIALMIYATQSKHGESWRSLVEAALHPVPVLGTARHLASGLTHRRRVGRFRWRGGFRPLAHPAALQRRPGPALPAMPGRAELCGWSPLGKLRHTALRTIARPAVDSSPPGYRTVLHGGWPSAT